MVDRNWKARRWPGWPVRVIGVLPEPALCMAGVVPREVMLQHTYDKLSKGEQIRMVQDQYCSPTYNDNLARMILEIVEKRVVGVMHTSGASRINRYDFAVLLAKALGLDANLILPVE